MGNVGKCKQIFDIPCYVILNKTNTDLYLSKYLVVIVFGLNVAFNVFQ